MRGANRKTEDKAIRVVLRFERNNGRRPTDVRSKRLGYDVRSTQRIIEVKGIEKRLSDSGNWRFVQPTSAQLLLTERTFYIYIVDNLSQGVTHAGIYVLNRKDALPLLNVKPQVSFTLRVPADQRERFKKQ